MKENIEEEEFGDKIISNNNQVRKNLEAIYTDYFDGLYNEFQLKQMLLKLYKQTNLPSTIWSDMILAAQWKNATEEDFERKRQQIKGNAME
ncbi:hypothetical protein [Metabacillus fastidiosus]|uniref:hypothetical protein n=1 Tax=Metabacillus fastidiosus TaxID=1458 RepID=UPI000AF5567C|nr:hypothetical protein [Metabacillus fastidiosus]MED4462726.1 hypothetical protein [Metabacillus fastidiosus]